MSRAARRTPVRAAAERTLAAHAHAEAFPSPKRSALVNGHHTATEYRWRSLGPPALNRYARNCPDKFRLSAHLKALAMREEVDQWSRTELIARYRRLRAEVAEAYAQVLRLDEGDASQLDRAAADERLAGLLELRSAVRLRVQTEGITDAEIWGGRR